MNYSHDASHVILFRKKSEYGLYGLNTLQKRIAILRKLMPKPRENPFKETKYMYVIYMEPPASERSNQSLVTQAYFSVSLSDYRGRRGEGGEWGCEQWRPTCLWNNADLEYSLVWNLRTLPQRSVKPLVRGELN